MSGNVGISSLTDINIKILISLNSLSVNKHILKRKQFVIQTLKMCINSKELILFFLNKTCLQLYLYTTVIFAIIFLP